MLSSYIEIRYEIIDLICETFKDRYPITFEQKCAMRALVLNSKWKLDENYAMNYYDGELKSARHKIMYERDFF